MLQEPRDGSRITFGTTIQLQSGCRHEPRICWGHSRPNTDNKPLTRFNNPGRDHVTDNTFDETGRKNVGQFCSQMLTMEEVCHTLYHVERLILKCGLVIA